DLEDQGPPQDKQQRTETSWWGLGSQYWSHNPHQQGYFANYVVLLDMVGTRDAVFTMEGFSMYYAPDVVKKVWQAARHAGYSSFFPYEQGTWIDDDHKNINEIIKLPAIDIIHLDP
ncbi:MAG: glutamine cyclotransferase, partial [Phototrophicales bacterium]